MPIIDIRTTGIRESDKGLDALGRAASNLRPFWRELAQSLADEAQQRWPLRRRSGRLRKSLTWQGDRLGRGGVYEADPNMLRFGTNLFYSRFSQHGTRRQTARPLIHIDEQQHTEQLQIWLQGRAARAGLEVEPS